MHLVFPDQARPFATQVPREPIEWVSGRASREGQTGLFPPANPSIEVRGFARILLASFLSKGDFMRLQTPTESSTSPTELELSSSPEPAHQGSPDLLDRSVFDIFG